MVSYPVIPLPVNQGGTGAIAQNFVDLTTAQNVAGIKAFTSGVRLPIGIPLTVVAGANAKAGTGTLVSGAATIATTAVTANSLVFLTDTTNSLTNLGVLSVATVTAGTGFTVKSSNALDTSTFNWLIVESA